MRRCRRRHPPVIGSCLRPNHVPAWSPEGAPIFSRPPLLTHSLSSNTAPSSNTACPACTVPPNASNGGGPCPARAIAGGHLSLPRRAAPCVPLHLPPHPHPSPPHPLGRLPTDLPAHLKRALLHVPSSHPPRSLLRRPCAHTLLLYGRWGPAREAPHPPACALSYLHPLPACVYPPLCLSLTCTRRIPPFAVHPCQPFSVLLRALSSSPK